MSFTKDKPQSNTKEYKISFVSKNGNTVGFLNLSSQFSNALFKCSPQDVTFEQLSALAKSNPVAFFKSLEIKVEPILEPEAIDIEAF